MAIEINKLAGKGATKQHGVADVADVADADTVAMYAANGWYVERICPFNAKQYAQDGDMHQVNVVGKWIGR